IAVLGHDYREPDALAESIRNGIASDTDGSLMTVRTWVEIDAYLDTMMRVMDGFVLVWMVVIFLALSFGLVNTLMMAVFERVREIGLMRALGVRPSAIVYQVLIESLMLLVLGLVAGNVLAIGTTIWLQDGIDVSAVSEGLEMMGVASIMYPVLQWSDLVLANVVVIVLGIIASLLPAWRAAQYRPVEALGKI
ncbi:MAG: FtsX-like permease family protein, partial [Xanthomonadales bacterium]|nr:FtsX-like permease family protein [Xanthomonadales bacterium]